MKEAIVVTGSKGLIGNEITKQFKKTHKVHELDLQLGHDLTDESFVKDWFAHNKAKYLVNCFAINDHVKKQSTDESITYVNSHAGIVNRQQQDLFGVSLESINKFLCVNVTALFSVCREFAKNPLASAITNFASTYALVSPMPDLYSEGEKHIGYSVSKGAVLQLTRHLAVHLAPNIRVNCIAPGGVEHEQSRGFKIRYNKKVPICRMMRVDELNGLVKYLCSDESSYMTGSIVSIDGGWTTC